MGFNGTETLPPLDTISRTLTSATSSSSFGSSSGSMSSMQSLTIVIPATCSVIVLTVIIIVACFVLSTKHRSSHFENTILTAIGASGGDNRQSNLRQNSIGNLTNGTLCHGFSGNGTPHHGTPGNNCDGEPRYGTSGTLMSTNYDHYGFASNNGPSLNSDAFHMTLMGNSGGGKECMASAGNIELNNCMNGIYATTMKKQQSRPTVPNGQCQQNNSNSQNSITTCLDTKLYNGNNDDHLTSEQMSNDTVHYFQTPYALSRLPARPNDNDESMQLIDSGMPLPPPPTSMTTTGTMCCNGGNTLVPNGTVKQQQQQVNGSTTLGRPRTNANGDHVYDMPFPPKWV